MIIKLSYNDIDYKCDLTKPLDISIPTGQVKCFYAPDFMRYPLESGDFIGSVKKGAPVNFYNVKLNPHGNGTHTECLGHITKEHQSINTQLKNYHFVARLVTVQFSNRGASDRVITLQSLKSVCPDILAPALIIRTLPNGRDKLTQDYSGSNPPYLDKEAMKYIVDKEVKHLLLDLPSVDKEEDNGVLAAHHVFWNIGHNKIEKVNRKNCTITELIYVDDVIDDGLYFLNIQIAPIELDATPSKPVLYKLNKNVYGE